MASHSHPDPPRSARGEPPGRASDGRTGVYGITVAAQLAGMSVQALRLYERKGLLEPGRTAGGTRRYSDADIDRLRRVGQLIDEGINLTGIARVLGLEADNDTLHSSNTGLRVRNAALATDNTALRAANSGLRADNAALVADNAALSSDDSRPRRARPR